MSRPRQLERTLSLGLFVVAACSGTMTPETRRIRINDYLFGAFGGATVDIRDVCPSAATTEASITRPPWMVAAGFLTLGIYRPHEVQIRCHGGSK